MQKNYKHPDSRYLALSDALTENVLPDVDDFRLLRVFRARGGKVGVYHSELRNEVVVSVRGSSAGTLRGLFLNVVDDLDMGGGSTHKGFKRHTEALASEGVLDFVYGLWKDRPHVTYTGMSLGGAVALLLPLAQRGVVRPFSIVTFGAPRVTWSPSKLLWRLQALGCQRIVHYELHGDIITNLPPFRRWAQPGDVVKLPEAWGPDHSRQRYLEALEASVES